MKMLDVSDKYLQMFKAAGANVQDLTRCSVKKLKLDLKNIGIQEYFIRSRITSWAEAKKKYIQAQTDGKKISELRDALPKPGNIDREIHVLRVVFCVVGFLLTCISDTFVCSYGSLILNCSHW